jgi:hypothetical protein
MCTSYKYVGNLMVNVKKMFTKLPAKMEFFKDKSPYTPVLPTPLNTCWETWLVATVLCKKLKFLFHGKLT